jgi:hypothetical protein
VKRLLQAVALLQVLLVAGLAVRIVSVWTTPLPEFAEIPDLPATEPLPPPRPPAKVSTAVTDAIVGNDLFDEQRGQNKPDETVDAGPPETPVPPPSTVKLMGVMMTGGEPVGLLLDTSVKPDQQPVRKGEMFGDYQVVDIRADSVTLLGSASQKYEIPLRIEANAGGGQLGPPQPPRPGMAPPPGQPAAAHPAPATRPVAARPINPGGAEAQQKNMSARERAQAIAQKNADTRKNNQQRGPGGAAAGGPGGQEKAGPDPVQARLEALKQLREAAKGR